jgi:hypothetical protein
MRHLKILGSAAAVVTALMALSGGAAATTVTSEEATYTKTIKVTSVGHGILDNPIAKVECKVQVEGQIESHGSGVPVKGIATELEIGPCTNSWHVTTVAVGEVLAHHTSGSDGTLVSDGATVETTRFGVTCRYVTSNTQLGIATGGKEASVHINADIPFHSGSFLCGTGVTKLTGAGTTTPKELLLDK